MKLYNSFDVIEKSMSNFKKEFLNTTISLNNIALDRTTEVVEKNWPKFNKGLLNNVLKANNLGLNKLTIGTDLESRGNIIEAQLIDPNVTNQGYEKTFSKYSYPDLFQVIDTTPNEILKDDLFNEAYIKDKLNILDVYYLEKGLKCSKSICRVNVKDTDNNPIESGTGFVIKGGFLVTNHHVLVLSGIDFTNTSNIEFNVQYDINGDPMNSTRFNLQPDKFMLHSKEYDLSIIKIEDKDSKGIIDLAEFGYIALSENNNENDDNFLSIIQHPRGDYKKIVLRENYQIHHNEVQQFLKSDQPIDHLIWYATNTTNGSSGSPVFNDKWKLIAIHHSGVPVMKDGKYECIDGIYRTKEQLIVMRNFRDQIRYKANEGIKINYLIKLLQNNNYYDYGTH